MKEALIKLHLIFNENTELSREQIKELLRDTDIFKILSEDGLIQRLDFIEKQAFLQSYKKRTNSFFEQEQIIYSLGNQPTFDYLKALYQYEKEKYTKESDIGDELLYWLGAVQMYAIMILENYGELLWYNEACRKYFSAQELFEISAYALISVCPDVSEKYEYWVIEIMEKNAGALAEAVNNIVLPLARYKDHALGSRLLDEYLRRFDKSSERDVVWSIPVGLKGDKGSKWVTYTEVNYQDEAYRLEESDNFDGLPLVYAWGLTTVCNERRVFLRKEIIRWAVSCPEEFYKLFVHMVINNDEQLRTDIFAIAMSVCHVCRKNKIFLKIISCWVGTNIFQISQIDGVRNAVIRYYARTIMECAFSENLITGKQIEKCRPPYKSGNSLLLFSIEATAGSRMGDIE